MLDLKFIRQNVEIVKQGLKAKSSDFDLDHFLSLDEERRKILLVVEELKAERNKASDTIAKLKKENKDASDLLEQMKNIGTKIKALDDELAVKETEFKHLQLLIPNMPNKEVPVGGADANKEVKVWGKKPEFSFEPKPHWDIAEDLDIIDFKRASKISGAGFILFKNWAAKLERVLINYMLDIHTLKHGYTEVSPPFMVSGATMTGTGQLPKLEKDMYKIEGEDLYLIPTAEVPVTNIFRNEVLEEKDLPSSFVAYTPCFRKVAGAYGKDTRGMIRVHQFDKVELVRFVNPEKSYQELELLLSHAEYILQSLGLHYRVLMLASGDMSFAAAKCYDIEVWAPGQNRYLEVSSCSNFEDFQARRMSIKYKSKTKTELVHTLNGSGVALPRLVIALLETYQQKDGTIKLPEVLQKFI